MKSKTVALLFGVKIILLLLLAHFASRLLPYEGNFAYRPLLELYHLPFPVTALASFDGAHYLNIAREGYHQFDTVFFPLYPLLIKLLAPIFNNNHLLAALTIANVSGLLGLLLMNYWLKKMFSQKISFFAMMFYFAFPTSFFFHTAYTESLFLLTTMLFLTQALSKNYLRAAFFGFFLSLTRLVGVFSPILLFLLLDKKQLKRLGFLLTMAIFAGLATYIFFLYKTTGEPFSFITSQQSIGLSRSAPVVLLPQVYFRYLKILLFSDHTYQYFVAAFEVGIFSFMLITALIFGLTGLQKKDNKKIILSIFSLSHLIVPTLTGTFLSSPRFALFSLASFLFLAAINNNVVKYIILTIFLVLQIIGALFFIQGYFIS